MFEFRIQYRDVKVLVEANQRSCFGKRQYEANLIEKEFEKFQRKCFLFDKIRKSFIEFSISNFKSSIGQASIDTTNQV